MEMTEQKKNRMVRNLFRLGLALLVFPWLVFLALRILIEFVGQAAVENVAVMSMTVYFFVAIPVGIGLLVASFFVFIRERFESGRSS
jgi:hypothetical protein